MFLRSGSIAVTGGSQGCAPARSRLLLRRKRPRGCAVEAGAPGGDERTGSRLVPPDVRSPGIAPRRAAVPMIDRRSALGLRSSRRVFGFAGKALFHKELLDTL